MRPTAGDQQLRRLYVVERFVSGIDVEQLVEISLDEHLATASRTRSDRSASFVGAVAIPDDETCLCFFAATDADAVTRAARLQSRPQDRLLDVIVVGDNLFLSSERNESR